MSKKERGGPKKYPGHTRHRKEQPHAPRDSPPLPHSPRRRPSRKHTEPIRIFVLAHSKGRRGKQAAQNNAIGRPAGPGRKNVLRRWRPVIWRRPSFKTRRNAFAEGNHLQGKPKKACEKRNSVFDCGAQKPPPAINKKQKRSDAYAPNG